MKVIPCVFLGVAFLTTTALAQPAPSGIFYVHCEANGQGGTVDLTVDPARNTVDNVHASITATSIEWSVQKDDATGMAHVKHDYALDRIQGTLNDHMALWSTTGNNDASPGYFDTNYTCRKSDVPPAGKI
jgi:hypothetical protein